MVRHFTSSSVKPLPRRCASRDTSFANCRCALDSPEVELEFLFSFFSCLTDTCPFRDAKDFLSVARKPGDNNSVQKIAITVPVNRTNASRGKLRIMLAAVHSILDVKQLLTGTDCWILWYPMVPFFVMSPRRYIAKFALRTERRYVIYCVVVATLLNVISM